MPTVGTAYRPSSQQVGHPTAAPPCRCERPLDGGDGDCIWCGRGIPPR